MHRVGQAFVPVHAVVVPAMHGQARTPILPMIALACATAFAQTYTSGPQVVTFFSDVDDSGQPYALYLPPSFDASKQYPLVISLHGAGSNHRLNLRRVFGQGNRPGETDGEASRYFPKLRDVDYIVASPFARGTMGYQGIAEKDVYDVMADVKRRFPIDESRVYLTGLSMGGGGALWLGLTRPGLWAAIAPVCPAAPAGTEDLAPNALDLAVHIFHGERDPVVPVDVSREWQKSYWRWTPKSSTWNIPECGTIPGTTRIRTAQSLIGSASSGERPSPTASGSLAPPINMMRLIG